ncbi:signal peptidase I [Abditibacterium utsteinense]|uniref:Signal peptidase I n=1 Tax=Abditibacterium utsteinense TaxID=1960156 RepID=A0A2S8SXG1_9BACT|nr:signal peptidase I [Abditibacterium utsteinense]PQV65439.1 signal peptidase I [Abditibacterium utsteinense]
MKFNLRVFWIFLPMFWALSDAKPCRADDWPLPVRIFYIPSGAMEPTLQVGDRMLVDMRVYDSHTPQNGEVAIFKAPTAALLNSPLASTDIDFVKRVVGTPGDVVTVVNRQLFRNGAPVREPYTRWAEPNLAVEAEMPRYSYDMKVVAGTVYSREYLGPDEPGPWARNNVIISHKDQKTVSAAKAGAVPPNQFLMLGDHRNNSNDSHIWGFAPRQSFVGRALFVFWPLHHLKMMP